MSGYTPTLPIYQYDSNRLFASLATETEYVRARLAAYANDLISLGADGLRLDAAKREWSHDAPPFSVTLFKPNLHRYSRGRHL